MSGDVVIDRIGLLVTNDPELGEGPLGVVRDAALVIEDGRVAAVERAGAAGDERLDAGGRCVIPGFVDSHTHLVFAGDRAEEFAARMAGAPYEAGGIRVTTEATAGRERPRSSTLARRAGAPRRVAPGSPTSRSSPATGSRSRPSGGCARSPPSSPTTSPSSAPTRSRAEYEGRADDYVELVCGEMLEACAPYCRWIDVFCERGAFDPEQSRAVLEAGRAAGLGLRVHGNQLGPGPGVAARGRARARRRSTTAPTSTTPTSRRSPAARPSPPSSRRPTSRPASPTPTRARAIDAGVAVAIATNCNPGSSYTTSMAFCIALAVRELGMTIDEALLAATLGGARALRRDDLGHLAPGARADAVVLDAPSYAHLVYRPGVPLARDVVTGGERP